MYSNIAINDISLQMTHIQTFETDYPFIAQCQLLMFQWKKLLESIVGKGENADNQYFLLKNNIFNPSIK